jgi:hypothetical protein
MAAFLCNINIIRRMRRGPTVYRNLILPKRRPCRISSGPKKPESAGPDSAYEPLTGVL